MGLRCRAVLAHAAGRPSRGQYRGRFTITQLELMVHGDALRYFIGASRRRVEAARDRACATEVPANIPRVPPADPETTRWFAEEVQPHESELRAYLRAKFSAHLDIDDLVQETYARLLQAREQAPLRSAKAYLFTTARNAAFDIFRRRKIVAIDGLAEIELLPVFEYRPGVAEAVCHDQELQLLTAGTPPRVPSPPADQSTTSQAVPRPSASTIVKSRNFLTVLTGLLVGVATGPAQTSTTGTPAST